MESSAWRDESWGDCERWPVTVLTWRAAVDCSRYEDRRPEKLGHRRLTAAYGGQSVTMSRRNADDIELRCLLAGRVRRRGTAVLHLADTCKQGEPACSQSAPPPSTSVVDGGAGWCARTSTRNTPAEQQNSSPTEAASAGTAECRREWHFRNPVASGRVTSPAKAGNVFKTDIINYFRPRKWQQSWHYDVGLPQPDAWHFIMEIGLLSVVCEFRLTVNV